MKDQFNNQFLRYKDVMLKFLIAVGNFLHDKCYECGSEQNYDLYCHSLMEMLKYGENCHFLCN